MSIVPQVRADRAMRPASFLRMGWAPHRHWTLECRGHCGTPTAGLLRLEVSPTLNSATHNKQPGIMLRTAIMLILQVLISSAAVEVTPRKYCSRHVLDQCGASPGGMHLP